MVKSAFIVIILTTLMAGVAANGTVSFALSKPALVSAPSKKLSAARRAACGIETGSR